MRQQCITVKQCRPVSDAGSESTTVTVNNSTQPVCVMFLLSTCHQRPDQLLNYQECQRHDSMRENGPQEEGVHVKRFVLHTTLSSRSAIQLHEGIRHRQIVYYAVHSSRRTSQIPALVSK